MPIPTEPIGSIPRPVELIEALGRLDTGDIQRSEYEQILDSALRDTIRRFEKTESTARDAALAEREMGL